MAVDEITSEQIVEAATGAGIGGRTNWLANTHLLLRPEASSLFVLEDETIRVEVVGASPLPIRPLPVEAAARLNDQRARCRCVWVAWQYFPEVRKPILDCPVTVEG